MTLSFALEPTKAPTRLVCYVQTPLGIRLPLWTTPVGHLTPWMGRLAALAALQAGPAPKKGRKVMPYYCPSCDFVSPIPFRRCPSCQEGRMHHVPEGPAPAPRGRSRRRAVLDGNLSDPPERITTGLPCVDWLLSGGQIPGCVYLLSGEGGCGKSTLVTQMASGLAAAGKATLYASSEEAAPQFDERAQRVGFPEGGAYFLETSRITEALREAEGASMVILDSISTMVDPEIDAAPGTVAQYKACSRRAIGWARRNGATVWLLAHVTKDGDIAGPESIQHDVDAVLFLEPGTSDDTRTLRIARKHRFGRAPLSVPLTVTPSGLLSWEPVAV